ncbi:hypothetical protein, partial [uncultured Parasutterella sp.]|uniref:hypothetical protein n=1 Tax=uncultured Parasutterella sp. TaxID=1263098 RepID=UPI0025964C4A
AQTWILLLFACRILRFFIVGNFKFIEDSASLHLDIPKKFILDRSDLHGIFTILNKNRFFLNSQTVLRKKGIFLITKVRMQHMQTISKAPNVL